jgi:hypothetical protein
MRSIIESVANKTGVDKLPVDERELLTRLGVPTMSGKEFQKRLEEVAKEAEKSHAQAIEAKTAGRPMAGVNADGSYYDPRERIVLSNSTNSPYVIERVDDLPIEDNPPAVYDPKNRTLYVRKDADADEIKNYIIGMSESKPESANIPDLDIFKDMIVKLSERSDPQINLEVTLPESKKTVKKQTIDHDDDGNIISIITEEIEEE